MPEGAGAFPKPWLIQISNGGSRNQESFQQTKYHGSVHENALEEQGKLLKIDSIREFGRFREFFLIAPKKHFEFRKTPLFREPAVRIGSLFGLLCRNDSWSKTGVLFCNLGNVMVTQVTCGAKNWGNSGPRINENLRPLSHATKDPPESRFGTGRKILTVTAPLAPLCGN